jgi:hypothetical protein
VLIIGFLVMHITINYVSLWSGLEMSEDSSERTR